MNERGSFILSTIKDTCNYSCIVLVMFTEKRFRRIFLRKSKRSFGLPGDSDAVRFCLKDSNIGDGYRGERKREGRSYELQSNPIRSQYPLQFPSPMIRSIGASASHQIVRNRVICLITFNSQSRIVLFRGVKEERFKWPRSQRQFFRVCLFQRTLLTCNVVHFILKQKLTDYPI